jgi:hypothetical protein
MADYSVDVNNSGSLDSDVHLDGLDNVKIDTTLHGGTTLNSESEVTLHSDATARLTLDPVTTNSTTASTIDLEPVAVDSCVRIELAPVAPTVVRSPWEQRVGFSLFGIELAAISWCGESTTFVEPAPARPLVMGATHQDRHGGQHQEGHGGHHQDGHGDRPKRDGGGLAIRVGS